MAGPTLYRSVLSTGRGPKLRPVASPGAVSLVYGASNDRARNALPRARHDRKHALFDDCSQILRTDAAGAVDVYKFGVSGGPLNAAGLSVRAETQVSALNRAANGAFTYESSVVQMIPGGAGARGTALSLERQLVYDYLELVGRKPFGNLRP